VSRLQGLLRSTKCHRTSSSGFELELVPVVKKLDEIAGYENIICDSKMGIKLLNRVPDIIPPIRDRNKKDGTNIAVSVIGNSHNDSNSVMSSVAKELKTPDLIQPFATQMSHALSQQAKSVCFPDDLGAVAFPDSEPSGTFVQSRIPAPAVTSEEALSSANIQSVGIIDVSTMEEQVEPLDNIVSSACSSLPVSEHHKSEEKKKKKDHKEHKHKDKDRNREERKHKHKHKDKDKDRHKGEKVEISIPLKITIRKDKISLGLSLEPVAGTGLKFKIQKGRLKGGPYSTDSSPQSAPSRGLKIKISKEVISNFSNSMTGPSGFSSETPSSSRKRVRSSPQSSELVTPPGPPAKASRFSTSSGEQRRSGNTCSINGKQNGVEHYSAPGGKVRCGRGGPRGNCYMTPTLQIQHPQPYQPYPQYYQAFPPLPAGLGPQPFLYGYYPPTTYIYVPTSLTCWSCS
jgi:cyclin T